MDGLQHAVAGGMWGECHYKTSYENSDGIESQKRQRSAKHTDRISFIYLTFKMFIGLNYDISFPILLLVQKCHYVLRGEGGWAISKK